MTEQTRSALRELQRIDQEIQEARDQVAAFAPQLDEVEEPAIRLESEVTTTRGRLQEMRLEERRLEVVSQEKRSRTSKLEERLNQVRNVREEAAVRAELDLVRSAVESDEQEALSLLDQIRKLELRLQEQESALEQARAEVEPRRKELMEQRAEAERALAEAQERRASFAGDVDDRELRVYESIRSGGRRQAVATLTADGACGHCFSVVPLQVQNEIRHGATLIRCEACGVILAAPRPEDEDAPDDDAPGEGAPDEVGAEGEDAAPDA